MLVFDELEENKGGINPEDEERVNNHFLLHC